MHTVSTLHASCLPRERLLHEGVHALDLPNLLSILLNSGTHQAPVMQVAQHVAELCAQGKLTVQDLLVIKGIGPARAATIVAALALGERLLQLRNQKTLLSPELVAVSMGEFVHLNQEHLVAFFISSRGTVLRRQVVSVGTVNHTLAHPREIFRPAVVEYATALILAHNHPSGNLSPSQADITLTREISQAGKMMGIELLDHVICTTVGHLSLKMVQPELFCYANPV